MSEKHLPVSVITPEKITWEGEVDSLVVPAYEGQWGILPGHAPLLAQLVPGVVSLKMGEDTQHLSVSGGFVEVQGGKVSLFAETAELPEEIDVERARQAAEKARQSLKGAPPDAVEKAQVALLRALARMKVLEKAQVQARRSSL